MKDPCCCLLIKDPLQMFVNRNSRTSNAVNECVSFYSHKCDRVTKSGLDLDPLPSIRNVYVSLLSSWNSWNMDSSPASGVCIV
jgi:hypothetical protein